MNERTDDNTRRTVITADDVRDVARSGGDAVWVNEYSIITDEARDAARQQGVELRESSDDSVGTAPSPLPTDVPEGERPPRVPARVQPRSDAVVSGGRVAVDGSEIVPADVAVSRGEVVAVGSDLRTDGLQVDATGLLVLPGVFDPHVHLGLFAPLEEELRSEGTSALLGGVTSVGCFMDGAGSHRQRLRDAATLAAREAPVDIIPHLVIGEREQLSEIDAYLEMGVRSFKVYMCGLPGLIEPVDDAFMADLFAQLAPHRHRVQVCVHAENAALVQRARDQLQARVEEPDLMQWAQAHPEEAEAEAVQRAASLARAQGIRLYFVHISSRAGLDAVRRARADGAHVRAETTSPYLTEPPSGDSEQLGKMVPPLRGRDTVDALWRALQAGDIDTVGTDNVTLTRGEKNLGGSMWDVLPGYPALGTHLPILLHEGYHARNVSLSRIAEVATRRPAEIFGLYPRKGALLPGSDADCTVVDLEKERLVQAADLGSRSDFSLVAGRKLRGWPIMTMKGGQIAALSGRLQQQSPRGNLILRRGSSE